MQEKSFVYPGTFLSYEEEFLAGSNAFEDGTGSVYSDSIGVMSLDSKTHEASVRKATRPTKILERGAIVIALVSTVKSSSVLVEILEAEKNGERLVVHNQNGSIMVFNVSNEYVRNLEDAFRMGDIVKARILEVTRYGIELETKSNDLGVIKAFGVKSRKPLILIDGRLRDPVTGAMEERKISSDYALK
ncbi:MAG: exosome complex RNA-binding protein Csl4 [archaeon]